MLADFLSQRVAVQPEQIGGLDLVAPRGGQRRRDQRAFHIPQNAVVKTGRRQRLAKTREIIARDILPSIRRGWFGPRRGSRTRRA